MLLALLVAPLLAQNPSIAVHLNHDQYVTGERAKVTVQSDRDGYLIVLHADPDGRVRVIFPLDPSDDAFIRGGRKFEVRGRGEKDAFQIDADDGAGTVLAAVSTDPLNYADFVVNDHWDFRALGGPSATVKDDPLARLLDVVQKMAGDSSQFDYDEATYVVQSDRIASDYRYGYDGYGSRYHFGLGVGYDPFCSDPFFFGWSGCYGYGGGWGYRFGFGVGYPIYRPYRVYRPFIFSWRSNGATREPRFVIPSGRTRYTPVQVRPREQSNVFGTWTRDRGARPEVGSRGTPRGPAIAPRMRPSRPNSEPRISRPMPTSRPAPRSSGGMRNGGGGRRH